MCANFSNEPDNRVLEAKSGLVLFEVRCHLRTQAQQVIDQLARPPGSRVAVEMLNGPLKSLGHHQGTEVGAAVEAVIFDRAEDVHVFGSFPLFRPVLGAFRKIMRIYTLVQELQMLTSQRPVAFEV